LNNSKKNSLPIIQKNTTDLSRVTDQIDTTNKLLTKINTIEKRNWWDGLDSKWKELLLMNLKLNETENYDYLEFADFTNVWEIYSVKSDYKDYVNEDLNYDISDLELEKIVGLQNLNICQSDVSDLSPISKLFSLVILHCADNNISDITPISRLHDLKVLNCMYNPIDSFKPLSNLKKITHIFTENAPLDLSEILSSSDKIEILFSSNRILNFDLISNFLQLKELYCRNSGISGLSPILNLSNLISLELGGNLIEDLTPLGNLRNLKSLHLNYNIVEDLSPISKLENLEELWCDSNLIKSIKPIFNLKKMEAVWCAFNLIPKSEVYEFQELNRDCEFNWDSKRMQVSEPRVLIVDDNKNQLQLLSGQIKSILSKDLLFNDFSIEIASDGIEAFEKYKTKGFDILFLNLNRDRFEILNLIKKIREWLNPIIIYGAKTDHKIVVECVKSGATEYLNMPYNFSELKAIIKKCIYYY